MGQKFELDKTSHDRLSWAADVVEKSTQDAFKILDALQKDFERAVSADRLDDAGQLQWRIEYLTEYVMDSSRPIVAGSYLSDDYYLSVDFSDVDENGRRDFYPYLHDAKTGRLVADPIICYVKPQIDFSQIIASIVSRVCKSNHDAIKLTGKLQELKERKVTEVEGFLWMSKNIDADFHPDYERDMTSKAKELGLIS